MKLRRWSSSATLWAAGLAALLAFGPGAARADEHQRGERRERQRQRVDDRHERDRDRDAARNDDRRDGRYARNDDRRDGREYDRHERRDYDRHDGRDYDRHDGRDYDRHEARDSWARYDGRYGRTIYVRVAPERCRPAAYPPVCERPARGWAGYYDPYCRESFPSLSLYLAHASAHGHVAFVWRFGGDSPLPVYFEAHPVIARCGD